MHQTNVRYFLFPWCSQAFSAFTRFIFTNETVVQKVILKPKRNTEVDAAEWQIVYSQDFCDLDASSWSELTRGNMVTRPKKDEVFVNKIPLDVMRCMGIALSNDKWLDDIAIWAITGEVTKYFYMSLLR